MGAQMLKQAATKTNDVAGDGTTTATVLAQAIVTEGLRNLAAGANPMLLKRGIDAGTRAVVEAIKKQSIPVKGHADIEHIAAIAANDPEIGKLLAEAMEKVGHDGVITIEEGKSLKIEVEYTEGMQFDRGYISPYFVSDLQRMEASLDEPYVLLTDKKISGTSDLIPVLEKLVQTGHKDMLIVAEDVDAEALATLVVNKLRGILNVRGGQGAGVRRSAQGDAARPGDADRRNAHFRRGRQEARGRRRWPTWAERGASSSTKDDTTIIEGRGKPEEIQARIKQIRVQIDETTSDYDKEKLQERLAKLSGGVAVIKVGAATEIELKEKKARVEDALHATRAAIEEGIIPGGGATLLRAASAVDALELDGEQRTGAEILKRALAGAVAPARRERRPRRQRGGRAPEPRETRQLGLRRHVGELRRPGQGGHHRPGQGHPQCARERRQRGGHDPQHRSAGQRPGRGRRAFPGIRPSRDVRLGPRRWGQLRLLLAADHRPKNALTGDWSSASCLIP